MNKIYVESIIVALNSTNDLGFKYPIGNEELTQKVRELESQGIIYYKAIDSKWVFLNKRSVFFKGE